MASMDKFHGGCSQGKGKQNLLSMEISLNSSSCLLSSGFRFSFFNGVSRYPSPILSSEAQSCDLFLDIIDFRFLRSHYCSN